jgi:hypothetical protein
MAINGRDVYQGPDLALYGHPTRAGAEVLKMSGLKQLEYLPEANAAPDQVTRHMGSAQIGK